MKKKLFTLLLAVAASVGTVFAWDYERVQIGDLYYNLDATNRTAEVMNSLCSGAIIIPPSVTYNSVSYSVTGIGEEALAYCSSLTSVTIPNSVISIGNSAFSGCSGLTSVTIPNSVTSIGESAFSGCSGLTSVTIPNSVTSIGERAFRNCSGLTSPVYNAHVFVIMPTSYSGAYIIPNGIESIANSAFSGCRGLTSVTIPNSVTSIGGWAFSSCTGLTSVTIPNSVTSIGGYAFAYCSGLNAVHISDLAAWCNISFSYSYSSNPLCYAHHLYLDNDEITNLVIPSSVTNIKSGAFEGGSGITSVLIPNSVTYIGEGAFSGCALTSVTIESTTPPNVCSSYTCHGEDCYCNGPDFSSHLQNIYIPCGSLEAYQAAAGWSNYASKIKYAPYPSYAITKKAENGNITTSSTDFTMCDTEHPVICTANPNRGCYFVRWADGNTENPRTIELTQDTTMEAIFDYLLTGKCGKDSALTWTFEPASMALNITGKGALSENYTYGTFIESLTIGNEVTTIGEDAFYKCANLKNVIIGSSVKVLEAKAFYNCSSIETITCYGQRPPTVNTNALYGLPYSTIVYVPKDYLETYTMHDAWGLYDVRPLEAETVQTNDIKVTPSENTADVVWPQTANAATYELVIKDKNGNVICTLVFNAGGQLTQIAFAAPSRINAPAQAQAAGFAFTVTGLESGTAYDLTLTAKNGSGATLNSRTVSFSTQGPTALEDIADDASSASGTQKVMIDGQIYILRDGKVYNATGAQVK